MLPSARLCARAAWKGEQTPFVCTTDLHAHVLAGPSFVVVPGMADARKGAKPVRTMARSATIIPNFVGCVICLLG